MLNLPPEALALLNALCFAISDVLIRNAMRSAPLAMCLVGLRGAQLLLLLPLAALEVRTAAVNGAGVAWFVFAGLLNPAMFSVLYTVGIRRIGVSRASPIKGVSPIFGAAFAILLLGERPIAIHALGIVLVVAGIITISLDPKGMTTRTWRRRDALFPILAASCSGFGANLFKFGILAMPSAYLGSALASVSAAVLTISAVALGGHLDVKHLRGTAGRSLLFAGFIGGMGIVLQVSALRIGEVSVVLPLVQISPLLTIAISYVFLRQVERFSWNIIFGAPMTVAGSILVAAFRG
jgi:drug/metabolite transporter (DMT)-like permease